MTTPEEEASVPATMSQVKRIIRRKLRKHPEHEEQALNIYPMMDMMTILLVFLIMQFSVASANVVQSKELEIPYSTADKEAIDAVIVKIASNAVVVDDENVLALRNGLVDPSQKQGGGNGFLITPLFNKMKKRAEELKTIAQFRGGGGNASFVGEVQIIADRRTPYRTLVEVVYSLGQAEFKTLRFVVLRQKQSS